MRIYFKLVHTYCLVIFTVFWLDGGAVLWVSTQYSYPHLQPWLVSADVHQNFLQIFIFKGNFQKFFLDETDFFNPIQARGGWKTPPIGLIALLVPLGVKIERWYFL